MLPVAESGVENQLNQFFANGLTELVLHIGEHLRAVKVLICTESLVNILALLLVVKIFDADLYGESCFGSVSVFGDGLRRQRIAGYFALKLQVGCSVNGLEARVARDIVEQLVL